MHRKKKNITEINYNKNWLQFILEKRILCQDGSSITVLIKKQDMHHTEIVFNLKARKRFVFVSQLRKQKLILVSWFSGMAGETVSWKMKNVFYFPNHDALIRPLYCCCTTKSNFFGLVLACPFNFSIYFFHIVYFSILK